MSRVAVCHSSAIGLAELTYWFEPPSRQPGLMQQLIRPPTATPSIAIPTRLLFLALQDHGQAIRSWLGAEVRGARLRASLGNAKLQVIPVQFIDAEHYLPFVLFAGDSQVYGFGLLVRIQLDGRREFYLPVVMYGEVVTADRHLVALDAIDRLAILFA